MTPAGWSWRDVPRRSARPPEPAPDVDGTARTLRDLEATVRRLCVTVEAMRAEIVAKTPEPTPDWLPHTTSDVTLEQAIAWARTNNVGLPARQDADLILSAINSARVVVHRLPPFRLVKPWGRS